MFSLPRAHRSPGCGSSQHLSIGLKLKVNGENYQSRQDQLSLSGLLSEMGIESPRVAVELNLQIVPKAHYPDTVLKDGDCIEVVGFVGGG